MLEIKTTTETGKDLKLWLDEEEKEMKATLKGLTKNEKAYEKEKNGYKCIHCGIAEHPKTGKKVNALVKINDDIKEFLKKTKQEIEELKERERQEELTFEVIETSNSGAWVIQDLLLVPKEKLMSDEQQEKIRELENILGEQQRFAGASKEIKAKELPVEEGETYTLSEIIEMCKEHSQSWQETKKEKQEKQEDEERALEVAKETAEKVKVNSYTVPCNDSNEECNTDIITVYMTPSGKTEEVRNHTW